MPLDRDGHSLRFGDRVMVQTVPYGRISFATILTTETHNPALKDCVLVQFENGTRQWIGAEHVAVYQEER